MSVAEDGETDSEPNETSSGPKPERETRPDDAPTGTMPIDQSGLGRDKIHRIKEGTGQGARDWTGITRDGDVIINIDGRAVNLGPFSDYLP